MSTSTELITRYCELKPELAIALKRARLFTNDYYDDKGRKIALKPGDKEFNQLKYVFSLIYLHGLPSYWQEKYDHEGYRVISKEFIVGEFKQDFYVRFWLPTKRSSINQGLLEELPQSQILNLATAYKVVTPVTIKQTIKNNPQRYSTEIFAYQSNFSKNMIKLDYCLTGRADLQAGLDYCEQTKNTKDKAKLLGLLQYSTLKDNGHYDYRQQHHSPLDNYRVYTNDVEISNKVKKVIWPSGDYWNYDIKNCHPEILKIFCGELSIDTSELDYWELYGQEKLTNKYNICPKSLKRVSTDIINGATFARKGSIYQRCLVAEDQKMELYQEVKENISFLIELVDYVCESKRCCKDKFWMLTTSYEQESITWLCSAYHRKRYNFEVYSNQHDGIVISRELSPRLLELFNDRFDLNLVLKPF